MSEEKLKITIAPDGSTQIKVIGVKGPNCRSLTRTIEEAIGKTIGRVFTEEMRETVGRVQHKHQQ